METGSVPPPDTVRTDLSTHPLFVVLPQLLSKYGIVIVGGVYFAGFLIVTLHEAQFGIYQPSPFKPRVLAAGALFAVLATVVAMGSLTVYDLLPLRSLTFISGTLVSRKLQLYRWTTLSFYYLLAVQVITSLSLFAFDRSSLLQGMSRSGTILWPCFGIVTIGWLLKVRQESERTPSRFALLSALLLLLWFILGLSSPTPFFWFNVWAWVTGMIAVALVVAFDRLDDDPVAAFMALSCIITPPYLFAEKVYPHIRVEWGGGAPQKATLQLVSPMRPHGTLNEEVLLLEESEYGYFVLTSDQNRVAHFVPRQKVDGLSFDKSRNEID